MGVRMIVGDVRDAIRTLTDNSVDLVWTSFPFMNLRSYLPPDHPMKDREIGAENTPADYLDTMLELTEEFARVLTEHGSLGVELGDSCVDTETQILSRSGWKHWDELVVGEDVLTLNPESRLAEWQPVDAVNVHPAKPRVMLEMEAERGHSSLTTANHRWLVERRRTPGVGWDLAGAKNPAAKLTADQVAEIRRIYGPGRGRGYKTRSPNRQSDLAKRFGVTQAIISKIVRGDHWVERDPFPDLPRDSRNRLTRSWQPMETTSADLNAEDRIPVVAVLANAPTDPKYSDALVETVAWHWTEGHNRKPGKGRTKYAGIYISQSNVVHPHYCERIRRCLTTLFGSPVSRLPGVKNAGPCWREVIWPSNPEQTEFRLNAAAARVIREYAPNRVVRIDWLAELTPAQLELFLHVSSFGDGHARRSEVTLAQASYKDDGNAHERAEAFQAAAIMSGHYASIQRDYTNESWVVYWGTKRYFKPSRMHCTWVKHDGIVWCPTTRNGSWMARRDGYPFFTGNSSGSGGAGGDYEAGGLREGQYRFDGTAVKNRRNGSDGDARRRSTRQQASAERGKPDGGSWSNRQVDVELGIRPPTVRFRGERPGYPLDKSLCGIPTLYTWSLAYGRNLLRTPMSVADTLEYIDKCVADGMTTDEAVSAARDFATAFPEREYGRWRIRNLAVWARPNPTVGREGDKMRRATSFITMACKSADRWFDLDAVRTDNPRANEFSRTRAQLNRGNPGFHTEENLEDAAQNPLGAPPLDFWVMSPAQYRGSHYAVMPEQLCHIPIESQCPRRVCRTCGTPSRRISFVAPSPYTDLPGIAEIRGGGRAKTPAGLGKTGLAHGNETRVALTIGWTSCGCTGTGDLWDDGHQELEVEIEAALTEARKRKTAKAERKRIFDEVLPPLYIKLAVMYRGRTDGMHEGDGWRAGVVLDPFGGTGTTAVAASGLGRDCILIDLDEANVPLVRERVGLFLDEVEHLSPAPVVDTVNSA